MRKKIIIIDDEPEMSELLKNRLQANGYEVITAANGLEGYARTMVHKPDLIILDVSMPILDGYSFAKEIRTDPQCKHIPILVFTAKAHMKELLAIEGFHNFMIKPFNSEELIQKVREMLTDK